jgi:RES domain-containing protein
MHLTNARYAGPLYRALNPVYARDPLSGRGAELYGGRFNAKGVAALYTALDPAGALRESNQAGSLQPTILVSYQADTGPIFDTRDTGALSKYGNLQILVGGRKCLEGNRCQRRIFPRR